MENRFKDLIDSFLFIGILLLVYWTLGFLINKIFKFEIRRKSGYMICIIGGFILKRGLIAVLR